jgi:co-chaperonin GroES (HSP10)
MVKLIAPDGKIVLKKYTEKTASGLEVPGGDKDQSRIGEVYAFGKPLEKDPKIELKKGQKIVFKKYVSNDLYIAELNEKFDFIEYEDVCAILEDK